LSQPRRLVGLRRIDDWKSSCHWHALVPLMDIIAGVAPALCNVQLYPADLAT
jgi:hypothetical protein